MQTETEHIFIGTEWDVICYVNFRLQFVTIFVETEFRNIAVKVADRMGTLF